MQKRPLPEIDPREAVELLASLALMRVLSLGPRSHDGACQCGGTNDDGPIFRTCAQSQLVWARVYQALGLSPEEVSKLNRYAADNWPFDFVPPGVKHDEELRRILQEKGWAR